MPPELKTVHKLYRKLLSLYPRTFRERLGESMQQTFDDLYHEQEQQAGEADPGFLLWMFLDTAIGIAREHLLLISPGDFMRTALKTFGASSLISLLLVLPLILMEIVNRRRFDEEFPYNLFFVLWSNLFAISLILAPLVQGWRARNPDKTYPVPAQGKTLLTNPWPAAILSVIMILSPFILMLVDSLGLVDMQTLINGPDPEVFYLPGWFFNLGFFLLQAAAGVIACVPVARTLRAGGSLFAHPVNLLIIAFLVGAMGYGVSSLVIDQWPCFIGIPMCD